MKSLKYLVAVFSIIGLYAAFYFILYWIVEYCLRNLI